MRSILRVSLRGRAEGGGQLWKLRGRGAGRRARRRGRRAGRRRRPHRPLGVRLRLPLGRLPGDSAPAGCSTLQRSHSLFAFRTGTEHQMRGRDGRESNGPAPSSFQHQTGRKVKRAPRGREEDPTPQSASLSQENGSALSYC